MQRLLRYLSRVAVHWPNVTTQMIADWCSTARPTPNDRYPPVAPNTASNRGWAARAALEAGQALGIDIDAADLLGDTPKRQPSDKAMRPLTRAEAAAVRTHARGGVITSDLSLLVTLGFAGASASESAIVTAACVDADRGFVRLPGANRVKARINPLDDWGQRTVSFQMRNRNCVNPNAPLCVTPGLPLESAKHSVTVRLRRVLQAAGVSHRPGVVPRSIRYTTAHRIAHAHGIIAAVKFLGVDSVDDTIAAFRRALPEGGRDGK